MVSSVLVTVPSDDLETVDSFDLTVPSLFSLVLLLLETSLSHPTSRVDNAKADVATHMTAIQFLILSFMGAKISDGWILTMGGFPPEAEQTEATFLKV